MIVDGRTFSPPLWWKPGEKGTRYRKNIGTRARPLRQLPRMFVWHWSGGARRTAAGVYATLRARGFAAHFIIETRGRIVQCADPYTTVCFHAGPANERSEACEICGGPSSDFKPEQYRAIAELADAHYANPAYSFPPIDRVLFGPGDSIATFKGHLEHRNVKKTKPDADGRVLGFLAGRWGLPVPPFPR